ncbi:MAG: hypothetical protein CVU57_24370 [Deltaproteobacteria bacterium HGW-Deltaproteobacteria-15]|jgi:PAS domain S-box-containing protein|nr:MAG: hypothetical protein CVU57_24370 [Deltaproteobacteria bacterium HGW-Deltaproteobacteria-15]
MRTQITLDNLSLSDLIDTQAIQFMMDDFYRVATVPMSIIDLKGEVLVGVGWQDICATFHRVHPETRRHCMESDLHLSAGIPAGEFRLYKCLNNMWDIATPIFVGGHHMGNVFSGQFFFDDETIDYDIFRSQAHKYGFDEKGYLDALDGVPRLSRRKVDSGMSFFIRIAEMIASMSYTNVKLSQSLAERDALTVSLQENREDLNRAQAVAHMGSWRLDFRRDELTWSDEAYMIFGVPIGTPLTYESFLSAIHPEDRGYVDKEWSAALRGVPYDIEHRIIVDDATKWVHEKAELEFNEDGSLKGGFGTVQDITEKKAAEANQTLLTNALRVLNRGGDLQSLVSETLRLIREATGFDAVGMRLRQNEDCPYFAQDGFSEEFLKEENFLCGKDHNGKIVRNAQGRVVLECTCGLVLSGQTDPGMSCFTRGGSFWTNSSHELLALPPEDDPRTNPRNRCIHAGYESVGLFPVRSGREIIGLLQLNGRGAGKFTPELIAVYENLAQNIGMALQRTMAEEALRESEEKLRSAFANAATGFAIMKPDGRFADANPAFCVLTGYSLDELQTLKFRRLIHPDDLAENMRLVSLMFAGQIGDFVLENRYVRKNGDPVWVRKSVSLGRDSEGAPRWIIALVEDITTRKQAEDALQKAHAQLQQHARKLEETNKELEGFAYTISHDLRAPLRAMNGYAKLISDDYGESLGDEGKRRLDVIEKNAIKMGMLIDDLLAFSHAGRTAMSISGIDMNGLVADVVETLKTSCADLKALIHVADLPPAKGDSRLIREVVSKLLENAVKFSRKSPDPRIEIGSIERDGEQVYFVKDNGVGFDMKYHDKLFGVFQRLVTDREFEGTGVGLAIVHRLITRHDGRVWAESKPGEGATFFFALKEKKGA